MGELLKNSVHIVKIERYSAEGLGVARIAGQVVFVKGAIRGEECKVKILKAGKKMAYAKIEEIITPSEHRVDPLCPVFGKCGGCDLMHMDYEEELYFKRQRVTDALKRLGGLAVEELDITGAEDWKGYRNKTICAVSEKGGRAAAGFFRERSHDVVEIENCLIQPEVFHRAVEAVLCCMAQSAVKAYDEKTGKGIVRHVFCRRAAVSGDTQVAVVCTKENIPEKDVLIREITSACPEVKSIILNVNNSRGNTVLTGEFITLWGNGKIEDELCSLRFSLSPRSFYQINHAQAEKLYQKAIAFAGLSGGETVLDLYCGTGTITLCMARHAKHVIGAEIVEEAIRDAEKNAEKNGIANADFYCADAAAAAAQLKNSGVKPDVVVVDPPRKGLSPEVPEILADMAPERIVYVSCDPGTLARDLKHFAELGYCVVKAEALDMFPRTRHVECVVLLFRESCRETAFIK